MKKRVLAAVLAAAMVMSLAACGKKSQNEEQSKETQSQVQTETQQESESQETQIQESSDVQEETAPESTQVGEEEVILSSLEHIREAVATELGDNYWPQMPFDSMMLEMMYGVTPDMYEAFLAEGPMMSAHVDALIVIQAKEDQVDVVKEALETYRQSQVDNTMVYPNHVGKIQASRVEVIDNYVCYVILGGDVMELMEQEDSDAAVIKHCEAENDKAIEAIKKAIEG